MKLAREPAQTALGFLSVIGDPQRGLFGGYLLLGPTGRPLEFHCTAGVQASRAQEILFGPTLDEYLFGELIGQTLYQKSTVEPLLVCTNHPATLALRDFVPVPVALVCEHDSAASDPKPPSHSTDSIHRIDAAHHRATPMPAFRCGRNRLSVAAANRDDQQAITDRLGRICESFDFAEPFGRIQAAIDEAQRSAQ